METKIEMTQEDEIIQLLKDRGIIESENDFNAFILVVGEDEDYHEVVIDGTLMIKKKVIKIVNNNTTHKNLKFGIFPSEELANFEANLRKEFYVGKLKKKLEKNKGS